MKCIIIGNGEQTKIHPDYTADYVIGADMYVEGVDLLVGDFDTLCIDSIPDNIETIRHPIEKDESDLELAVAEAIRRGFDTFYIYGCLGGRFDHTLASIAVLTSISQKGLCGFLIGKSQTITAITKGKLTLECNPPEVVSLFPAGDTAAGVTLTGFKYPLNNATLTNNNSLGLSNVALDSNAVIEVKNGTLIVVINRK